MNHAIHAGDLLELPVGVREIIATDPDDHGIYYQTATGECGYLTEAALADLGGKITRATTHTWRVARPDDLGNTPCVARIVFSDGGEYTGLVHRVVSEATGDQLHLLTGGHDDTWAVVDTGDVLILLRR